MDLLTYKELETGPGAQRDQGFGHQAWTWLLTLSPTVVTFMIALSVGLGMVATQVSLLPMLVLMAIFWGLTVVAMVGVIARWMTPGRGRHRMAA
ncbi:hypothetical protein ATKI12_5380 [Kitasatospora sp. Ki12]|uniref:hypothetical protein n=1 Tax=Kitasatospora xanthocidica TaxID=83382 RepID=UPI001679043C|nr:hypothetical protein [Kitasatospora xanthocidica]GHF55041.1 hypothetical protein GCM10018790_36280 [Kitasatospora xanthocidica]